MTSRHDDGDVIVPLHLEAVVARPQGWRGRSSSLVAVGLVAFVMVAVVLGTTLDDGQPSRSAPIAVVSAAAGSPTVRPSSRPTPTPEPLASRLPDHLVLGGQIPTEERLVFAAGLERLDLATGVLTQLPAPLDYSARPLPNGEIVCACVVRDFAANGGTGSSILRFGRYDRAGAPIVERDLVSFDGVVEAPEMGDGFNVTSAVDPEGRSLYMLVVERRPPAWTITLLVVDIETGDLTTSLEVGQIALDLDEAGPSPSPAAAPTPGDGPPDGVYVWGSAVAVAPGEQTAYMSVDEARPRDGSWTWRTVEWMVEFEPGQAPVSARLPRPAGLEPGSACAAEAVFVDAERLVRVCTAPFAGTVAVRRIGANGASLGDVQIVSAAIDGRSSLSILVDRSERAVFLWDPRDHALIRVDVDDGRVTEVVVPDTMRPDTGRPTGGQAWVGGTPAVVQSPDGRFLYAIGVNGAFSGAAGTPSGIWVFDLDAMGLVDHWEPRAYLSSLAVSEDGRFVYAAGISGIDVNGRENAWPASVTVYDAATGGIQVIHGSVAPDAWITFLPDP